MAFSLVLRGLYPADSARDAEFSRWCWGVFSLVLRVLIFSLVFRGLIFLLVLRRLYPTDSAGDARARLRDPVRGAGCRVADRSRGRGVKRPEVDAEHRHVFRGGGGRVARGRAR